MPGEQRWLASQADEELLSIEWPGAAEVRSLLVTSGT